jgi:hypothetical protein
MPIVDWLVVKMAVKLRENSHLDRDQPLFNKPNNQSFLLSGSLLRKCKATFGVELESTNTLSIIPCSL